MDNNKIEFFEQNFKKEPININEDELAELAENNAFIYGTCFADISHSVMVNREGGFYDGFKEGYRKAIEKIKIYETNLER